MKLFQSRTIRSKLSDFFLNVSASYFMILVVSPSFANKNLPDLYIALVNNFLLVIIYFIGSIIILEY